MATEDAGLAAEPSPISRARTADQLDLESPSLAALRDTTLRVPLVRTLPDVSAGARARLAAECPDAFDGDVWVAPVWCFLLRIGHRHVLVDTGDGGELALELAAAGVEPATIDDVVYTHAHRDHIRGAGLFPGARHHLHEADVALAGDAFDGIDLRPFRADFELAPGLHVVGAPGHTPGSAVVLVGGTAVLAGDAIHHPVLLRHPELRDGHDRDPDVARATRRRLLEMATRDGLVVGPAHFPAAFVQVSRAVDGEFDWTAVAPDLVAR